MKGKIQALSVKSIWVLIKERIGFSMNSVTILCKMDSGQKTDTA